ncbi:MAG: putative Protochlorophyllide reductase [Frankiales bacterium]|nr:putative Protochlorophyllide reductase [Frankiales bacterium]
MKVGNAVVAQSDAAGALPQLYASTMPDVGRGDYWGPALAEVRGAPKRVGRAKAAQDDAAARRLWDGSERLTGVTYRF